MKTKLGLVILAVTCSGMMMALFAMKMVADNCFRKDTDAILGFSNQLASIRDSLNNLGQVNLKLANDLAASRRQTFVFSNQFTAASGALVTTRASLQEAQEQIASLNQRLDSVPQEGGQPQRQRVAFAPTRPPRCDLNVEVSSDGSIRVFPMSSNAPATLVNSPP